MRNEMKERLLRMAREQAKKSYAPYSRFRVGAALLGKDGTVYEGCNVENASFGAGTCAERNALFHAVSQGCVEFLAIAVAGGKEENGEILWEESCMPCGICRQTLQEFCGDDFEVILSENVSYPLSRLFPFGFGKENLL